MAAQNASARAGTRAAQKHARVEARQKPNTALPYSEAKSLADELGAQLAPYCDRLEIAGSVRRRMPACHDVELVAIPRWEPDPAVLFGVRECNLLAEAVRSHPELLPLKPGVSELIPWRVKDEGRYWKLWHRGAGVQVDVFLTTPERWGLIYFIRTGPADYEHGALVRWKMLTDGGYSEDGQLHEADGRVVPTTEEEHVFRALAWRWRCPCLRGREGACRCGGGA